MSNVSSSNGQGGNCPKLRFDGFTEQWRLLRIGDVYAERSERGAENMELLSVTMTEGVKMRSDIEGKDNSSEDKSNYKIVYIGDMVYNSMRMWQGASGISQYDGIVSPAYTILKPRIPISNGFFAALFKTERLINEFRKNSQGMTSDTWNLKYPQIETIKIHIPSITEQEQIAAFLELLDAKIAKQRDLVESFKKYKRGLLQHIMRQNNDWEKVRLSDILFERKTYCEKDGTYEHATLSKEGVYGKTDRYDRDYLVMDDEKKYKITKLGDLCYNPANLKFGVICLNTYGDAIFSPIYITFEIAPNYNKDFIGLLLTRADFIKRALRYQQGTVYERMAVSPEDLLTMEISVPTLETQNRIAHLFTNLDARIKKNEFVLEGLQNGKKQLLSSLFV